MDQYKMDQYSLLLEKSLEKCNHWDCNHSESDYHFVYLDDNVKEPIEYESINDDDIPDADLVLDQIESVWRELQRKLSTHYIRMIQQYGPFESIVLNKKVKPNMLRNYMKCYQNILVNRHDDNHYIVWYELNKWNLRYRICLYNILNKKEIKRKILKKFNKYTLNAKYGTTIPVFKHKSQEVLIGMKKLINLWFEKQQKLRSKKKSPYSSPQRCDYSIKVGGNYIFILLNVFYTPKE